MEEEKQLNPIIKAIEEVIAENERLTSKAQELEIQKEKLELRERLYQSELAKTRNGLLKLAQSINTSPHASSEEYEKFYEYEHQKYRKDTKTEV